MTFVAASEHCAARPSQQKFEQLRTESAKQIHMSRALPYKCAGMGTVLELAINKPTWRTPSFQCLATLLPTAPSLSFAHPCAREHVVHHTYTVNIFCPALRVTVGVHKQHTLWRALLSLSFHAPLGACRPLSGPRTYALALRALATAYRRWRQSVQRLIPFLR